MRGKAPVKLTRGGASPLATRGAPQAKDRSPTIVLPAELSSASEPKVRSLKRGAAAVSLDDVFTRTS